MNQFIMDVRNAEREESEMSAVRKNQAAKKNRTVNAEKKQAENKSPLAWYDDRVKTLKAPASDNPCPAPGLTEFDVFDPDGFTGYDTPKQIYNYLPSLYTSACTASRTTQCSSVRRAAAKRISGAV